MWISTNSLVGTWLMNSMSPSIASMVESLNTAQEIWKIVEKFYSGAGNFVMMAQVEEDIMKFRKEQRP
ncbi:hypothetical protein PSY31_23480, partial [Shigella flexneri]|nr:hypothetical protein [Shigella flexneri]